MAPRLSQTELARALRDAYALENPEPWAALEGRAAARVAQGFLDLHERVRDLEPAQAALDQIQGVLGTADREVPLGAAEVVRELEARVAALRHNLAEARRQISDIIHDEDLPDEVSDDAADADGLLQQCQRILGDGFQVYFAGLGDFFCWECGPCAVDEDQACRECGAAAGSADQLRALAISRPARSVVAPPEQKEEGRAG